MWILLLWALLHTCFGELWWTHSTHSFWMCNQESSCCIKGDIYTSLVYAARKHPPAMWVFQLVHIIPTGEGIGYPLQCSWASLVAQLVKNLPAIQETRVQSLGREDPMEKEMAIHSSILAWSIPWTIQSMGSQRVGRDWATLTLLHFCTWNCQLFNFSHSCECVAVSHCSLNFYFPVTNK